MASLKVCGKKLRYEIYIAGVIALSTSAIVIWFVLMMRASYVPAPRAVTPQEGAACQALPRGSQVMENKRRKCSNELYGSGRFRLL